VLSFNRAELSPHSQALYASKIISYAQGFMLMREAAKQLNWNLNYGGIALMWRGGCIIRRWFGDAGTNTTLYRTFYRN